MSSLLSDLAALSWSPVARRTKDCARRALREHVRSDHCEPADPTAWTCLPRPSRDALSQTTLSLVPCPASSSVTPSSVATSSWDPVTKTPRRRTSCHPWRRSRLGTVTTNFIRHRATGLHHDVDRARRALCQHIRGDHHNAVRRSILIVTPWRRPPSLTPMWPCQARHGLLHLPVAEQNPYEHRCRRARCHC
jgi:hypothetical protein